MERHVGRGRTREKASSANAAARCVAAAFTLSLVLAMTGCESVTTRPPVEVRPPAPEPSRVRTTTPIHAPRPLPAPPRREVARSQDIGYSRNGTPLTLYTLGDGPDRMFIFGGIHGDEPTSASLALELTMHLQAHPEALAGRTVSILTCANPDGLAKHSRFNSTGVDVNRNFPAKNWKRVGVRHGPSPASEPETRAIISAIETTRPNRIIAIHSAGRGRHCNNYDGPARGIAAAMGQYNRYPVKASMGYPTPGSFGSWAGIDRQIPTITLELPRDLDGPSCWAENRDALLAFVNVDGMRIAK